MPVILRPDDYALWLGDGRDASPSEQANLRHLLRPYEADEMRAQPVSTRVSSPFNEGPECIEPAAPQ